MSLMQRMENIRNKYDQNSKNKKKPKQSLFVSEVNTKTSSLPLSEKTSEESKYIDIGTIEKNYIKTEPQKMFTKFKIDN
ncbi:hypothetical protein AB837_00325 [bacterium AB1]|nr:hypothetical protein AB837_00325 [bacterium AB1]